MLRVRTAPYQLLCQHEGDANYGHFFLQIPASSHYLTSNGIIFSPKRWQVVSLADICPLTAASTSTCLKDAKTLYFGYESVGIWKSYLKIG